MMGGIRSIEVARLIKQIAEQNHVTPAEVRRDIQAAIDDAFNNPNKTADVALHQSRIVKKGAVPDVDEYMSYILTERYSGRLYQLIESKQNRAKRRRKKNKSFAD